jgi:Protein of unknown function (DUF3303)
VDARVRQYASVSFVAPTSRSGFKAPKSFWSTYPEEAFLKYMIEYTIRTPGATHEQNFSNTEGLLSAFGKWKPEDGLTVQAFLSNLNGNGGYVLVEAADPKVIVAFVTKYTFWNDINVVPVVDVSESVPIGAASLAWAKSASKS